MNLDPFATASAVPSSTARTSQSPGPGTQHPAPRLGLSTGALYPDIATEDVPEVAARLGFGDLELMLQTAGEYEEGFLREVGRRCRASGCPVHAIHVWQELHPLLSPYRRRAEEGRALFDRAIAGAAMLGARVLVWHGPKRAEVQASDAWERFLEITAEVAAACGAAGVTLALENVSWCALATVREVSAFAARLPDLAPPEGLGFAFDPFQAAEAGANPFMVLAAMGDRVVDVHLSDRREGAPAARHLLPGDGDLPWPALLRAIAGSYAGPLVVEGIVGNDLAALTRVKTHLDPLVRAAMVGAGDDRCAGAPPPGVLEGIRLFNDRRFYEAHETIEHEWHAERGEIRRLYQGILQIGVGFHHALGGNHRGALLLLADGIDKTARFVPSCLGIDTARLVVESTVCLDRLRELGVDRLAEFDPATIPVVQLDDHRNESARAAISHPV